MVEWNEQAGRLREAVLDLLWEQWGAFGAAGLSLAKKVPFVADPEALILATMRFGAGEARLTDEVLDWLSRNGGLISLQRLKNLQTSSRVGTREGLVGLGSFMEQQGFRNGKALSIWAGKVSSESGQPWVSETSELREMSVVPDLRREECFLLRMRSVFGVSARPEVLTWLLTHEEGYAAEIARDTGWFSKSVQAILNDLELAGLVISHPEGKRKVFALRRRNGILDPTLGLGDLHWLSQGPFYLGVLYAIQTADRLAKMPEASESAKAIAIRGEMTSLNAAFRLSGMKDPFAGGGFLKGTELVECFERGLRDLVKVLEGRDFG
ncbi:MAG: helix-turn-helix domain-containing protein [Verrucomicrobia bacterium]|nr:helix-turn-helix domain-containing protein [Verrucomicrobiota bacterium]